MSRNRLKLSPSHFQDVLLAQRLRDAIDRLNSGIPAAARDDAFRRIAVPDRPTLIANSRAFHQRLRNESRG
jgi:type I restriction enzyme R subunit